MKKFTLLFTMLLCAICASAATVTDVITASDLAATGTSYTAFSGITFNSTASYEGCTSKNVGIQLNTGTTAVNSVTYYRGIATSQSGGLVKKVSVDMEYIKNHIITHFECICF